MRIHPLVQETLSIIRYVRQSPEGWNLDVAQLRMSFRSALSRMRKTGEQLGWDSRDLDEAGYALVALADECVLSRGGSAAFEWMREQLQLSLFGETTAGEGFFARLQALRADPTRVHVLSVYYLALSLGFRGQYVNHELALQELTEGVRLDLERFGGLPDAELSPNGARPKDTIAQRSDGRIVLGIGISAAVLASLFYAGLYLDLAVRVATVVG